MDNDAPGAAPQESQPELSLQDLVGQAFEEAEKADTEGSEEPGQLPRDGEPLVDADPASSRGAGDPAQGAQAKPQESPAPAKKGGPTRDEQGRFAKKEETPGKQPDGQPAQQQTQDAAESQPAVVPDPAQGETAVVGPPKSWSVEAKAEFDKLPDAVKAAISRRESEVQDGFQKYEDFKGMDEFVAYAKQNGQTPAQLAQNYRQVENLLNTNPIAGVLHICKIANVDPARLANAVGQVDAGLGRPAPHLQQQQPGHQPAPQAQPEMQPGFQPVQPAYDPTIANNPIMREVQALKADIQSRDRAGKEAEFNAFMADPANKYASNVVNEMAAFMEANPGTPLKAAYENALYMNPETRAVMIKEAADARLEEQRQASQAARDASASVSGSAPAGPGAEGDQFANGSVRDIVQAAYNAQERRV